MKEFEYKLISMDFDGTLLTSDKKVSEKTKNTLLKYKNNGYYIVGVTARCLESIKDELPLDIFNYLVFNNGTCIYDVEKESLDYIGTIEKDKIRQILPLIESKTRRINLVSATKYYLYKYRNDSSKNFIIFIDNLDEVLEEIVRINVFFDNQEEIEYYYNLLKDKFPNLNVGIMQDSGDEEKWLIINPSGIDKSTTLESLGRNLKVSNDEMIFFGDGLNDALVMTKVGCSVAMENALDSIKKQAKYITTSNDEDGISKFLEENIRCK